jgi:peroxiredoxin
VSKLRLVVLALIVLAVPLSVFIRRAVEDDDDITPLLRGAEAPAFSLPELEGEGEVSSADLDGHRYVLNFWASWCDQCEGLLDIMHKNRDRFPDVTFLGVIVQDTPAAARKLVDETQADWPMLLDDGEKVARAYGVRGAPVTFFVGQDGKISGTMVGPFSRPLLEEQIRKMS